MPSRYNYLYQGQTLDAETGLAYNQFRYYDPEEGVYISQDPIGLASDEFNLYSYVEDTNIEIDEFGLYKKAYRKRTVKEVKALRKRFNNRGRKRFLKKLAKDRNAIEERGLSPSDVARMEKGQVPSGYVVHHKVPIYRGGNNSTKNLDLIKEKEHLNNYKDLHDYDEGDNPYFDR